MKITYYNNPDADTSSIINNNITKNFSSAILAEFGYTISDLLSIEREEMKRIRNMLRNGLIDGTISEYRNNHFVVRVIKGTRLFIITDCDNNFSFFKISHKF